MIQEFFKKITIFFSIYLIAFAPVLAEINNNTLPTNPNITSGSATINQTSNSLTINQTTDKLITNWSSFNIGKDASVEFIQPSSSSTALNRVNASDPSYIYGSLKANGKIILINPSGVLFQGGSKVDVGAIIASSLNLKDGDFLNDQYIFEKDGLAGTVNNAGSINAFKGGAVALLSDQVTNDGNINTPDGTTALLSGERITLTLNGNRLIKYTIDRGTLNSLVQNKQAINAGDGIIILSAKGLSDVSQSVVKNTGTLTAESISKQGGKIYLSAIEGEVINSGTLSVNSTEDKGGNIEITGDEITIETNSTLSATGKTGGGQILVGGSWQNSDPSVYQSTITTVETDTLIDASATLNGDGGEIVIWSDITNKDSITTASGTLYAKGGSQEGDGGRIETSGYKLISTGVTGSADLWLFDPYEYTIGSSEASTIVGLLEVGTNVTINTANSASHGISGASGTDAINVNSDIIASSGSATLTFDGSTTNIGANVTSGGDLIIDGNTVLTSNSTLQSGGSISFKGTINGGYDLTALTTSSSGRIIFNSEVGGSTALSSLTTGQSSGTVYGTTYINNNITTTAAQNYNNDVIVGVRGAAQFTNGDFSSGSLGWTAVNSSVYLGTTTIGGFISPTDTTNASLDNEYHRGSFSGSPSTSFTSGKVTMNTGSGSCRTGRCVIRGPYIISDGSVSLSVGDTISFKWQAVGSGDAYDSYGYLLNTSSGSTVTILNSSGTSQGSTSLTTATTTITSGQAGNYKFVFVAGSYDLSGGLYLGGSLSIDDVATTSSSSDLFSADPASTITVTGTSVNFDQAVSISEDLVISNSANSIAVGVISGSSTLTKSGSGKLTLSATNTNTGDITVSAGILNVTGALADTVAVAVSSGATYDSDTTDTIGSIAGAGTIDIASTRTLSVGNNNSTTSFTGIIQGSGALTKVGTGTLTLSGANTYSGGTSVSNGILKAGAASSGTIGSATSGPFGTGDITINSGKTLNVDSNLIHNTKTNNGTISNKPTTSLTYASGTSSVVYGGTINNALTNNDNVSVTYSSSDTNVATVNSSTGAVTFKTIGSTTITATHTSNEYQNASDNYVLNITKATPTISGLSNQTKKTSDSSYTLAGTASVSGVTISYSSSDTSVATVNSSTGEVTIVGTGTAIITASITGTSNYNAATATYALEVSNNSSSGASDTAIRTVKETAKKNNDDIINSISRNVFKTNNKPLITYGPTNNTGVSRSTNIINQTPTTNPTPASVPTTPSPSQPVVKQEAVPTPKQTEVNNAPTVTNEPSTNLNVASVKITSFTVQTDGSITVRRTEATTTANIQTESFVQSAKIVTLRPNQATKVERSFEAKVTSTEAVITPQSGSTTSFEELGKTIGSTQLVVEVNGQSYSFNINVSENGIVIKPADEESQQFAETNNNVVTGSGILEVVNNLSIPADQIKTIMFDYNS